MNVIFYIQIVIAGIFLLDIITLVVLSWGNPANFMYYLCRPLWGLISGKRIGMMIGLLIRFAEVLFVGASVMSLFNKLF